jgi:hypothetical protein
MEHTVPLVLGLLTTAVTLAVLHYDKRGGPRADSGLGGLLALATGGLVYMVAGLRRGEWGQE